MLFVDHKPIDGFSGDLQEVSAETGPPRGTRITGACGAELYTIGRGGNWTVSGAVVKERRTAGGRAHTE